MSNPTRNSQHAGAAISAADIAALMTEGRKLPFQGRHAPSHNPDPTSYFSPSDMERSQYDLAVQLRWCNEDGNRCQQMRSFEGYNAHASGCR